MNHRPINWPAILGGRAAPEGARPPVPALGELLRAAAQNAPPGERAPRPGRRNADRKERRSGRSSPSGPSTHPHKGSVLDVTIGTGGDRT